MTLHERLDVLFAKSDQLFAEANRNKKKSKKAFKLSTFLIDWSGGRNKPPKDAPVHKTPESLRDKFLGLFK
jgi:hypothetical protein